MSETISLSIDGVQMSARPGQTIIEAADAAGIYIPRLCHKPGLEAYGSCRVCTVQVEWPSLFGLHDAGRPTA